MRRSHPLLKLVKKVASNKTINPIVAKTILRFSDFLSDDFLFKAPIVGNIEFNYGSETKSFVLFSNGDDSVVSEHYFSSEGFESTSVKIFSYLSKDARIILDIGANTGVYSIAAAISNENSDIYAFEPVPRIVKRLKHNIAINNLENVHPRDWLVSDEDGLQALYVPKGKITTSASSAKGFRNCTETISAASLTIDTFVAQNNLPSIDLIKIDTESTEPCVLRGGIRTIENMRPIILCEVLNGLTESEIHKVMDKLQYRYFWITQKGLIEMDVIVGDPKSKYRNYIFISNEKVNCLDEFII